MFLLDKELTGGIDIDLSSVNWRKVKSQVNRLQKRVFRASSEKRWSTVRSLQNLLIRSRSAKLWALRHFSLRFADRFKCVAGIDGNVLNEIDLQNYQPQPVKRVFIPKEDGSKRPLGVPTLKDRIMQKVISMALEPEWEAKYEENSFGFRKNRCTHDAIRCLVKDIKELQKYLKTKDNSDGFGWILITDIEKYFENLSHEAVLSKIKSFNSTIEKWLKAGVVYRGRKIKTRKGVPQGSVIGSLLGNIALDGLERLFGAEDSEGNYIPPLQRAGKNRGVSLIRYVDDIAVVAPSKEILVSHVLPKIKVFLKRIGLNLHSAKSKIFRLDQPFEFLGFSISNSINKSEPAFLLAPSEKSVDKLLDHVLNILLINENSLPSDLIKEINHIIRRWTNFYRCCQNEEAFLYIDQQIRNLLELWYPEFGFGQLISPIAFLKGKSSRRGQLTDLNERINTNQNIGGSIKMNKNKQIVTRKFGLLPETKEDFEEIRNALVKIRDLKNIYASEMIEYIKAYSYRDFKYSSINKARQAVYDKLHFSSIKSSQYKSIRLKERSKRCAFFTAYNAVRNWVIRTENIKTIVPWLIRQIWSNPTIASKFLRGKGFTSRELYSLSLKFDCFGFRQYLSAFYLNNLIGQIRNLFLQSSPSTSNQNPQQLVEIIVKTLENIANNGHNMLPIPKFKGLSVQIVNRDVYKADFTNSTVELGFLYRIQNKCDINSKSGRIDELIWRGFEPRLPTINLQNQKIVLHLPFEKVEDIEAETEPSREDIEIGVDLGLKHFAVVSVWDKNKNEEISRYFIDQRELFDKRFSNGKIVPLAVLNAGRKPTNIKAKLIELRKQMKAIQRKKNEYENRLKQMGVTSFNSKLKWNKLSRTLTRLWNKIKRTNTQITKYLAHYVIEIAKHHRANTIKVENLKWVKHSRRGDVGKFLAFWQTHWFFSQTQRAISDQCRQYGVKFEQVKAAYTSQTCSKCGEIGSRNRKQFSCKKCGLNLDSDLNAARNIAKSEAQKAINSLA